MTPQEDMDTLHEYWEVKNINPKRLQTVPTLWYSRQGKHTEAVNDKWLSGIPREGEGR